MRQRIEENPQLRQSEVKAELQRKKSNPSFKVKEAHAKRPGRQAIYNLVKGQMYAASKRRRSNTGKSSKLKLKGKKGKRILDFKFETHKPKVEVDKLARRRNNMKLW